MQWLAESVVPAAAAVLPAVQGLQSHAYHSREVSQASELHQRAIEQAAEQHDEAIAQERQFHQAGSRLAGKLHAAEIKHSEALHSDQKTLSLELHLQQLQQELRHHRQAMRIDVEAARRENLRDVWSQKSRKADTLVITTTLMFGAFFGLVTEGIMEQATASFLVISYSGSLGLAFAALFVCMLFTMRYQARMADYNIYDEKQIYICGDSHLNFEEYYACHCSVFARVANHSFLVGTAALILAASVLSWSRFVDRFDNYPAAITFAVTTVGSVATLLLLLVFFFPTRTRAYSEGIGSNRSTLEAMMEAITRDQETDLMQPPRDELQHQLDIHDKQMRDMEAFDSSFSPREAVDQKMDTAPSLPQANKSWIKRLRKKTKRNRGPSEHPVPTLLSQAVAATLVSGVGGEERSIIPDHSAGDAASGTASDSSSVSSAPSDGEGLSTDTGGQLSMSSFGRSDRGEDSSPVSLDYDIPLSDPSATEASEPEFASSDWSSSASESSRRLHKRRSRHARREHSKSPVRAQRNNADRPPSRSALANAALEVEVVDPDSYSRREHSQSPVRRASPRSRNNGDRALSRSSLAQAALEVEPEDAWWNASDTSYLEGDSSSTRARGRHHAASSEGRSSPRSRSRGSPRSRTRGSPAKQGSRVSFHPEV
jgi:hypothetical protein